MVTRYVKRTWDREAALKALDVTEVPWDPSEGVVNGQSADGWSGTNIPGYHTQGHVITVDPYAPLGVTIHELAHIVLGHTEEAHTPLYSRTEQIERLHTNETEAETVALLVADILGLNDREHPRRESRKYINMYQDSGWAYPRQDKIDAAIEIILAAGRE